MPCLFAVLAEYEFNCWNLVSKRMSAPGTFGNVIAGCGDVIVLVVKDVSLLFG